MAKVRSGRGGRGLMARARAARFPLAAPTWPASVARPDPERRVGLDYDHEWSRRYPVRLARAMVMDNVARPAARLMAPATVRGLEHLGHVEGPVIFACNHASHIDTPLLLTNLPVEFRHKTVVAAASDYFFDRTWKSVLWSFALAAIPIERSKVNRRSADTAAELRRGRLEPGHLPRGRPLPRRLDPALPRRVPPTWPAGPGGRSSPCTCTALDTCCPSRRRPATGRPPVARAPSPQRGGRLRRSPIAVLFGPPCVPTPTRTPTASPSASRRPWPPWPARSTRIGGRPGAPVSAVAPLPGAERAHRGPEASPWRRAWALDEPPARRGAKDWPA